MAKAARRKLKVFQAQFGFHDSVVAAPNQAAALRAWGIRQNLFAEGQAHVTDDRQAVDAARAHPETPFFRLAGSNDPYELDPKALPRIPDSPRRKGAKSTSAPKPRASKPPADRSGLDAAEAALHAVDARRKREEARLGERLADLEQEMAERQATYVADRRVASTAVAAARKAYRKAGGKD